MLIPLWVLGWGSSLKHVLQWLPDLISSGINLLNAFQHSTWIPNTSLTLKGHKARLFYSLHLFLDSYPPQNIPWPYILVCRARIPGTILDSLFYLFHMEPTNCLLSVSKTHSESNHFSLLPSQSYSITRRGTMSFLSTAVSPCLPLHTLKSPWSSKNENKACSSWGLNCQMRLLYSWKEIHTGPVWPSLPCISVCLYVLDVS